MLRVMIKKYAKSFMFLCFAATLLCCSAVLLCSSVVMKKRPIDWARSSQRLLKKSNPVTSDELAKVYDEVVLEYEKLNGPANRTKEKVEKLNYLERRREKLETRYWYTKYSELVDTCLPKPE